MDNLQLNPLTFPLWWYSVGLKIAWQWLASEIQYGLRQTSIIFFVKHISEPFYKDYTRAGRFLGWFFRSIMIIIKLAIFLVRAALSAAVFTVYLFALPAVIILILYQIIPFKI